MGGALADGKLVKREEVLTAMFWKVLTDKVSGFLKAKVGYMQFDLAPLKARQESEGVSASLTRHPVNAVEKVRFHKYGGNIHCSATSASTRPSATAPTICGKKASII